MLCPKICSMTTIVQKHFLTLYICHSWRRNPLGRQRGKSLKQKDGQKTAVNNTVSFDAFLPQRERFLTEHAMDVITQ